MLQAPTSEAKTVSVQSNSPFAPQSEREPYLDAFSAVGTYSFPGAKSVASVRSPLTQSSQAVHGMQSAYGNQAILRVLQSSQQVARLTPLRPSQSIMVQRQCACGGSPESEGECAECKEKREGALQRSVGNQVAPTAVRTAPPVVHNVLSSPGQPLDADARVFMETRFGHDFSQVRVHTDARAAESAQAVNALAYTVGNNVVFGRGQYAPGTSEGRRLMAHELTHVVQQSTTTPSNKLKIAESGTEYEQEAAQMADIVLRTDQPLNHAQLHAPAQVYRQDNNTGTPAASGPMPQVCARPLDIRFLRKYFNHAFISDPPYIYAIRGLVAGNGVTTSCSTKTDASPPPDVPATSICKPCSPKPGQTIADVSSCLRNIYLAYANPNLYRNLPDPSDSFKHGPNSNSFAAALATCCLDPSSAGLGRVPGWEHRPADPCPIPLSGPSTPEPDREGPDAGQLDAGVVSAGAGAAADPTNLRQILTNWVPGPNRYGFQLKFQCSSSSGSVADLQAQAPNLIWREHVTYSRNDFSHRINPPNPTILPPGGVSFAAGSTTVVNPNLLEFNGVTDTHWTPTSAVRADDYALVLANPRPLPAIMESLQLYQFSRDGSTWTNFAGPFTLLRTLSRGIDGKLSFTTDKVGIHSVTEDYKP